MFRALRSSASGVMATVADDGVGASGDIAIGGHGVVGMRERAQLFEGSVTAGPNGSSGWVVQARLPILEAR